MILNCEHITVAYDDVVLSDITFSVHRGEFLCIVGENGGGKTTLLKAILGLIPYDAGHISMQSGISVGYVPQKTALHKNFPATAMEVILSGCRSRTPFYTKKDKALARRYAALLGIENPQKQCFYTLSGGQQQRVLLARALCAQNGILMLDEPITGLDPLVSTEFYTLLSRLCREENITVIMVSHDIRAAVSYADRILHLDKTVLFCGAALDYKNSALGKRFLGGCENA